METASIANIFWSPYRKNTNNKIGFSHNRQVIYAIHWHQLQRFKPRFESQNLIDRIINKSLEGGICHYYTISDLWNLALTFSNSIQQHRTRKYIIITIVCEGQKIIWSPNQSCTGFIYKLLPYSSVWTSLTRDPWVT